ncbi:hypothetical protein V1506DRAFT_200084 [Lipomyces tetrasporus]
MELLARNGQNSKLRPTLDSPFTTQDNSIQILAWARPSLEAPSHPWVLERLRSKQRDNAVECRLLGYEGDHIYRLLTTAGRVIRASTVQFAQEKRSLEDVGDAEVPPNKRWCDHTVPESWGDPTR